MMISVRQVLFQSGERLTKKFLYLVGNKRTPSIVTVFFEIFFQSVDPDTVSEDIIESLMEHHRSGRSLDELDKTIRDFRFASDFDVSKPGEHDITLPILGWWR